MKNRFIAGLMAAVLVFGSVSITAYADEKEDRLAAQLAMEIQSNNIANWPEGPAVTAESAILMDAASGAILYEKNIHKHQFPASTTKILTTLIAAERCQLNEIVDFSYEAVHSIPRGSNNIAMDAGEQLNMDECLNAILIRSANEVSYAVAEHIGGSWEEFAKIMNERARELGCVDSNFVNPNGLPDENHYTSAYDLAMIGRAFFENEYLCNITLTPTLRINASERQPDDIVDHNKMALIPGKEYAYEYLVGCKTGYTDDARATLVSCAQKDGLKLICVVLKDENPTYYEDTITLFNYGFGNFESVNISQTETKYNIEGAGLFYSNNDVFGSSEPILSLNKNAAIVKPRNIDFNALDSSISYETENDNQACLINYSYQGINLGSASVDFASNQDSYSFTSISVEEGKEKNKPTIFFINIVKVLLILAGILFAGFLIYVAYVIYKNQEHQNRNTRRRWRREKRKRARFNRNRKQQIRHDRRVEIREAKRRIKRNRKGRY